MDHVDFNDGTFDREKKKKLFITLDSQGQLREL